MRPVIAIRGATTRNLHGIDLDLPTDRFVVVTGPSGAGKSSLVFETLHAESRRRLALAEGEVELSGAVPAFRSLDGLPVTVGVDQRAHLTDVRATLSSLSGAYRLLLHLFEGSASAGCPTCGAEAGAHDAPRACEDILARFEGQRVRVLAPLSDGDLGDAKATLAALQRAGFSRLEIGGESVRIEEVRRIGRNARPAVWVDRLRVERADPTRLREAVELAYRVGGGRAIVRDEAGGERTYAMRPACTSCGTEVEPLPADAFRRGARTGCGACEGAGFQRGRADPCDVCAGTGLGEAARRASLGGRTLPSIHGATVAEAREFAAGLATDVSTAPLVRPLADVLDRLSFLGLASLTLGARGGSLPPSAASRARIAAVLASPLQGSLLLLDEPSAGLPKAARDALVEALRARVAEGQGVVVVEHEEALIRAADLVVEIGPGAGKEGGRVVAAGAPTELPATSLTSRLLRGHFAPVSASAPKPVRGLRVDVAGVGEVTLPEGGLVVLVGERPGASSAVLVALDSVVSSAEPAARGRREPTASRVVREAAGATTPRAFVATRLGVFTPLRTAFASLPEARVRAFDAARFGFGAGSLRCVACDGVGLLLDRPGRPTCPRCEGRRYERAIEEVRYRGASLADVLVGSIDEAGERFAALRPVSEPLAAARRLGLGHLALGRVLGSTSGGERARLAVASLLGGRASPPRWLLLDEPARGLHAIDVAGLVVVLRDLIERGVHVVVADDGERVAPHADWIVRVPDQGANPAVGRDDAVRHRGSPAAGAVDC